MTRLMMCLGAALLLASSCGLMATEEQMVTIRTDREDAVIMVDGIRQHGGTVFTVPMSRRQAHTVVAESQGEVRTASISRRASPVMALDILGTVLFIIPIIGVAGPGWWDLSPQDVALYFDGPAPPPPPKKEEERESFRMKPPKKTESGG